MSAEKQYPRNLRARYGVDNLETAEAYAAHKLGEAVSRLDDEKPAAAYLNLIDVVELLDLRLGEVDRLYYGESTIDYTTAKRSDVVRTGPLSTHVKYSHRSIRQLVTGQKDADKLSLSRVRYTIQSLSLLLEEVDVIDDAAAYSAGALRGWC